MNFKQNSLFKRNTELEEEQEVMQGGVLAVWGSPSSGKTTVSVKLADYLARKKKNTVYMTIKEESGRLCMIPVLWQGKRMEPMAGMNTKWSLYPPSVNMQTSQPFRRL